MLNVRFVETFNEKENKWQWSWNQRKIHSQLQQFALELRNVAIELILDTHNYNNNKKQSSNERNCTFHRKTVCVLECHVEISKMYKAKMFSQTLKIGGFSSVLFQMDMDNIDTIEIKVLFEGRQGKRERKNLDRNMT